MIFIGFTDIYEILEEFTFLLDRSFIPYDSHFGFTCVHLVTSVISWIPVNKHL